MKLARKAEVLFCPSPSFCPHNQPSGGGGRTIGAGGQRAKIHRASQIRLAAQPLNGEYAE